MSSFFKVCIPKVTHRGAGLGNELIPWARAIVASNVLGANVLLPAFGFNQRKYWRHFGTPRRDWVTHKIIETVLPEFEFTVNDFLDGGGDSLSEAIQCFSIKHKLSDRHAWAFTTQGMWGSYHHIREAKEHMKAMLYLSKFAPKNLHKIKSRLDSTKLTIGMHIRLGDFQKPLNTENYRGKFNASLPMQWYVNIVKSITQQLGDTVQFLVVSDGSLEQLSPLLEECINVVTTLDIPDSDISDMLALAESDLLICSVSSYSCWSAFLSDTPYIWFEPNLQQIDGYYSIWGNLSDQIKSGSYTKKHTEFTKENLDGLSMRGIPVSLEGIIPENLLLSINDKRKSLRFDNDLIHYGVLPIEEHI